MIKTRRNVFETNSSSMHSLSIASGVDKSDDSLEKNGVIFVELGQYGWGYDELNTTDEKLRYVLTHIHYGVIDESALDTVKDLVKSKTGSDIEIINYDENNFWIDHQSTDMLDDFYYDSGLSYRDFIEQVIFNPNYVIIIDNDNNWGLDGKIIKQIH